MKNLSKQLLSLAIVVGTLLTGCSGENNEILKDNPDKPNPSKTYKLIVNPTNESKLKERNLIITAQPNTVVPIAVNFKGSRNMYRLYMTKNLIGGSEGTVPFKYDGAVLKKDGSINLDASDKQEFTYNLKFPAPAVKDQTVQYVIWATHGRGDFRNFEKRNAVDSDGDEKGDAIGVITIKAGTVAPVSGTTVSAGVKSFSAVILAAPLNNGSSKSFISLFNNKIYAINQGEEYAALWDFGYYYGKTGKASFASAYDYPSDVINIPSISKVAKDELNRFYIQRAKTVTSFDTVTNDDLEKIAKPSTQRVKNLAVGEVLEFVDSYGNKGVIKIVKIEGTNGSNGKITFDVKVQVKSVPIKG